MSDSWPRSTMKQLMEAYDHLFRSNVPLSKLKDAAFGGRLFNGTKEEDGVAGRSMSWKLFLIADAPLTEPEETSLAKPPVHAIKRLREEYKQLMLENLRAPDGSYEDGLSIPEIGQLPRRADNFAANLQKNNPLSLDEDNPWKEWFASVDLRRTIRQDVERTFPDIEYFRDVEVQAQLTLILYVHSVTHPDIGYRQGMHELLAPIYLAVDFDSVESTCSKDDSDLETFCSRTWVAADAWALFSVVMDGVHDWYEWREPSPLGLLSPLKTQFRYGTNSNAGDGNGQGLKTFIAPIVLACQRLQTDFLRIADPVLFDSLQKAGVEPQIYGIRWLRLLFTREFSLRDAMLVWDGLFSSDRPFELVLWVCVAMLIRIRNQLIPSDYSSQLTYLLRYPSTSFSLHPSDANHAVLLLRQAFALYTAPSPATGASIMVENRNLLHIPIEVPDAPESRKRNAKPRRTTSAEVLQTKGRVGEDSASTSSRRRNETGAQSVQIGLPELIARGLMERGESLGINKTVMNAVSELRKNLPELTNSLIRSPPTGADVYTSFPMIDERPRPPWEPRTRFEMEKEVNELRALQKRLGEAVGVAVDALLQDEDSRQDEAILKKVKERKREAIESLAYVRDILNSSSTNIEEERLFGEKEYKRRRDMSRAQIEETERFRESRKPGETLLVRQPEPTAAIFVTPNERRERSIDGIPVSNTHPLASLSRSPPIARVLPNPPASSSTSTLNTGTHFQSTTHPLRQSPSNPMVGMSPTVPSQAPWNYTRSDFSTAVDAFTMPRPPPKSSTAYGRALHVTTPNPGNDPPPSLMQGRVKSDQPPRPRQDPLGAIPL